MGRVTVAMNTYDVAEVGAIPVEREDRRSTLAANDIDLVIELEVIYMNEVFFCGTPHRPSRVCIARVSDYRWCEVWCSEARSG